MISRPYDLYEQPSRWERLALASGIVFAVLQIAAIIFTAVFLLSQLPGIDAPREEWAATLADIPGMTGRLTTYLLVLPVPFLLLFLGGLYGVLRRAEGGSGTLSISILIAGAAVAMTWPMGILIAGLTSNIVKDGGDLATAWALDGMAPLSLALSAFPRTLLLAGTSLLLLDRELAPRWIGWSGNVLAVASLVGTGTLLFAEIVPVLLLSTMIFELWMLALSVSLVQARQAAPVAAPQAAPA